MGDGVDLEAVKDVQQQVWSKGDFAVVAHTVHLPAELLCEFADVTPGERVLDVACGSGNAAIAAARRFAEPTGIDYVPALLERGRERAAGERLDVEFIEGDAEQIPFEDDSFDVVLSIYGAMFAPNQERAADELLRVCRPGGRVAMANWTPGGWSGRMFATVGKHAPPPPGVDSPVLWGTEERVRELFGDRVSSLRVEPTEAVLRFRSPEHWLETFRRYFGPMQMAFERVGEDGAEALAEDLLAVVREFDQGEDTTKIHSEYLQVAAVKA